MNIIKSVVSCSLFTIFLCAQPQKPAKFDPNRVVKTVRWLSCAQKKTGNCMGAEQQRDIGCIPSADDKICFLSLHADEIKRLQKFHTKEIADINCVSSQLSHLSCDDTIH